MQGVWRTRALIYSLYGTSTLILPLVGGISVDFARTDSTYASLYDDVTIRFFIYHLITPFLSIEVNN